MGLSDESITSYPLPTTLADWRSFYCHIKFLLEKVGINAMGRTAPNPTVAALLFFVDLQASEIIIIIGATESVGSRHAEIVVLDSYDDLLIKNTHYKNIPFRFFVTLEPCSHFGKTPPCSERLLSYHSLKSLKVEFLDPNLKTSALPLFAKNSVRLIQPRNINQGLSPLDGFMERISNNRSRLHVKVAVSSDLCMGVEGERLIITKNQLSSIGMRLRLHIDAVFVATGTILSDTPSLGFRKENYDSNNIIEYNQNASFFSLLLGEGLSNDLIQKHDYQPARLFLLGHYSEKYDDFLCKQNQLTIKTGLLPKYFILKKNVYSWKEKNIDLTVIDISSDMLWAGLQSRWAKHFNNVLVEPGRRTMDSLLKNGLSKGDYVWILKSNKTARVLIAEQDCSEFNSNKLIFPPRELFTIGKKVFSQQVDEGCVEVFCLH